MKEFDAAPSGAQREKLNASPYDLVPFKEMTDAYVRVAEFGAKKYTQYWSSECQGLANVENVAKIEITLPEECARNVITRLSEAGLSPSANQDQLVNAQSAVSIEPSRFWELVNVADAMKGVLKPQSLTITFDKSKTRESITQKIKTIGSNRPVTEQMTLFLESAINERSFSLISEILESRNRNILSTNPVDAPFVEPMLTFTLTTTTGQVFSEGFFVQNAITVSGFWATISRVLRKHLLIYESDVRVKKTGCWNWSKGLSRVQLIGSLLRHTFAYLRGEERDGDSVLLHTDHILWNAVALAHNVHHDLEDGRRVEPPRDYQFNTAPETEPLAPTHKST